MSEEGRPPCTDNPDLFFSTHPTEVKAAKALCRTCPIRLPCLRDALANREAYGVFGGLTEVERARMHVNTPTEQICAITECSTPLPPSGQGRTRRYCCATHNRLGASRAYVARQETA